MAAARPRTHIARGELPFEVIADPRGTGLYAEWSDEGALVSVSFIIKGKVVRDGPVPRQILVVSPSKAVGPHGETWEDGAGQSAYGANFEDYEPSTQSFADWLKRQVIGLRFDRLSQGEIDSARTRRKVLTAALVAAVCAACWALRALLYTALEVYLLGCIVAVLAALMVPLTVPIVVRGKRVEMFDGDV
jgi:hypothetical protein